jgi:hypothetical protein
MKRYSPLLLILVLVGALAASQTASAAASPPVAPTVPQLPSRTTEAEEAEELEAEEEGFEFEACEAGETFEFGLEGEAEEEELEAEEEESEPGEEECGEEEGRKGAFVTAPAACRVQRAESSITTLPGSDRLRLTLRYQTYSPAAVSIALKLKDHKGTLAIEHTTRHLGQKGVLHLTTDLPDAVIERAVKAQEFEVGLRAINTPGFCDGLLEQHLSSKQPVGKGRVYTQPISR